jgi:hypothetical protein
MEKSAPSAQNIFVVMSGTHGVEGPAGSFLQRETLSRHTELLDRLPSNTGLLLIHALNPWGYAHGRRTDHCNIDLNRNGAFGTLHNSGYDKYIEVVQPEVWDGDAERCLLQTAQQSGLDFKQALTGGQSDHRDGLFYTGTKEAWSMGILREICGRYLAHAEHVALIDVHTGIGDYAKGDIFLPFDSRTSPDALRMMSWFGNGVQFPNAKDAGNSSVSSKVSGDVLTTMRAWVPGTFSPCALEMGVLPLHESLPAIVAENWLCHHRKKTKVSLETQFLSLSIRDKFQSVFYPKGDKFWHGALWSRNLNIAEAMIKGMQQS